MTDTERQRKRNGDTNGRNWLHLDVERVPFLGKVIVKAKLNDPTAIIFFKACCLCVLLYGVSKLGYWIYQLAKVSGP